MNTENLTLLGDEHLEVLILDIELADPDLDELTASEREVALLIADGLSNAEIAERRGVALRTVANQVRSIFGKLGVSSRWDLALLITRRAVDGTSSPRTSAAPMRPRPQPVRAPWLVNSAATVSVLRDAYAHVGADFEATRARRGVVYVNDGELLREDYCALFEELAAATGRPQLGLELARGLPVGAVGLLEWLAMSAPTLGDALAAVSEHGGLLHGGGHRVTHAHGDELVIAYWVDGHTAPRVVTDWAFGRLLDRTRSVVGDALQLIEVRLQHENPGDGHTEEFFGCPVSYGASVNEIVMPRELAELRLPGGDPDVFATLSDIARARIGGPAQWTPTSVVRHAILRELDLGGSPRAPGIAQQLGMSVSDLHGILRRAGVTFEQLADASRIDRALRYITQHGGRTLEALVADDDDAPLSSVIR